MKITDEEIQKEMIFRYSAINSAYQCLKRYELEYVLGIKSNQPESIDLQFGTAMHLALNSSFEDIDPIMQFKDYWQSIGGLASHDLVDTAEILLTRWERLHKKKYKLFKAEERIGITLYGHRIEGTPDFVGEYEGVPSIIDFKTSRMAYDKKKIEVNEQMPLYAHMAKEVWGYEAQQLVYVVFCKQEKRIQVLKKTITKESQADALDNLALMMDDLSTRSQFPKNRNSCGYCPYYNKCYPKGDTV